MHGRRLLDAAATGVAEYTYGPFGQVTVAGSVRSPFQYTGRENDGTDSYYYRERYYNPTLHRFINEDPMYAATFSGSDCARFGGGRSANFQQPFHLGP